MDPPAKVNARATHTNTHTHKHTQTHALERNQRKEIITTNELNTKIKKRGGDREREREREREMCCETESPSFVSARACEVSRRTGE